ncbi:MAG TPA: hypothetical protein VHM89_05605 [Acidimicrobiales bacterium]|nr:hypothetical protein [Acidimicrobiales bacterium]
MSTFPLPSSSDAVGGQCPGAYGLGFSGLADPSFLATAAPHWPVVEVVRRRGRVTDARTTLDGRGAQFELTEGGSLVIERAARRSVFTTPDELSDPELVHPHLAPVGAAFAWWAQHEAFHAGAVAVDGGAWAILGDRSAGKSSTLAQLALAGHDVICDDMLVIDHGRALAGPRCVDLRLATAEGLGIGKPMVIRGGRERWRVALGPVPAELPFRGWIFLAWGDDLSADRLPGGERLALLAGHRSVMIEPTDPSTLLELASLPAWCLTRPKQLSSLPVAVDRLLDLTMS